MHNLNGVVCIFFAFELDEAVPLMLVCDFISRNVDIYYWTALREEFPENILVDLLVEVAGVNCCLLVALVERRDQRHTLIIIQK